MTHSRSLALALAAAFAACSTSPFGPRVPSSGNFSAAPAVVAPGDTVHLSLTNSSSAAIAALPCPLVLQRWNGSAWAATPDGAVLCVNVKDTLAPGDRYDRAKALPASMSEGTYRAAILVDSLGGRPQVQITSNSFDVMP